MGTFSLSPNIYISLCVAVWYSMCSLFTQYGQWMRFNENNKNNKCFFVFYVSRKRKSDEKLHRIIHLSAAALPLLWDRNGMVRRMLQNSKNKGSLSWNQCSPPNLGCRQLKWIVNSVNFWRSRFVGSVLILFGFFWPYWIQWRECSISWWLSTFYISGNIVRENDLD